MLPHKEKLIIRKNPKEEPGKVIPHNPFNQKKNAEWLLLERNEERRRKR